MDNSGKKIPVSDFYEDGNLRIEGFESENGRRDGTWRYYYPDGTLWSLGDFSNGLRHGRAVVYYENGQIRYSGQYQNDKEMGEWVFYDTTGKKIEVKQY